MERKKSALVAFILLLFVCLIPADVSGCNIVSLGIPPHGMPRPDGVPKLYFPIVIRKAGDVVYVMPQMTLHNCKIELLKNGILTNTFKYDSIMSGECLEFDSNETDVVCIYVNDRLVVDREV